MSLKTGRVFDIIKKLKEDGTLTFLVRVGIISPKYVNFFNIHARLEQELSRSKYKTLSVVENDIAQEFRVSPRTVQRARLIMIKPCQTLGI